MNKRSPSVSVIGGGIIGSWTALHLADPDARDLASFKPYVKKVKRYVSEHLPLLEHRKPAILETCMYTMTPDSNPIIDRLTDNVVVGCGFSGSGFKHAPATGWMLAALALGEEQSVPEGFRFDRYAVDRLAALASTK